MNLSRLRRTGTVLLATAALLAAPFALPATTLTTPAGATEADPGTPETIETVSADALPAPQVNGVVWDQEIVGTTVYAVGEFTAARPAGSPAGQDEVPRTNALAYDITTGELLDWAPTFDGAVRTIVAAKDGSVLYVGGAFSSVNGHASYRVGGLTPTTGRTVDVGLGTNAEVMVLALSEDGTLLYAGGAFTNANNTARTRVLEYDLAARKLTSFAPRVPDAYVRAIATEPGGTGVAIGGAFSSVNGSTRPGQGMAIVEARTGTLRRNNLSSVIHGSGAYASIMSLKADANGLYGAAFSQSGTLEGTFRANWRTGKLDWMLDCHGDSYDVQPVGDVVYISSHEHDCSNMGAFPNNWAEYHHGTAVVNDATGTVGRNTYTGYTNFAGQPGTSLLTFFPAFTGGTYTGMNQATWTVEGNEDYVVYGGEFLTVNGTAQQGLVRFARRELAPNKESGVTKGGAWALSATSKTAGQVSLGWKANWDRDDKTLTYEVYRDTFDSTPVYTRTVTAPFWDLPELSATDADVEPGSTHTYAVKATDKWGASTTSDWTTVTVKDGPGATPYAKRVIADGATSHWSFDEDTSATIADTLEANPATFSSWAYTRAITSALGAGYAAGTRNSTYVTTTTRMSAPTALTEEIWFRTTSTTGGHLIGFGSSRSGSSYYKDRVVYMRNDGRLSYLLYLRRNQVITSPKSYNDGQWHHMVVTTSPTDGSVLYVDGAAVATDATMTSSQSYSGYWRIAGDTLSGVPSRPSKATWNGDLDEAAVYPSALSSEDVAAHYGLGTGAIKPNQAPTAALELSATDLAVSADATASADTDGTLATYTWAWGDGGQEESTTEPTATHTYTQAGTYTVTLTVTDDKGATATAKRTVTVTAPATPDVPAQPDPVPPAQPDPAEPKAATALLADDFSQDHASGWGQADQGGAWSALWGAYDTAQGTGRLTLAGNGSSSRMTSPALAATDLDMTWTLALDTLPDNGGTVYLNHDLRSADGNAYRVKVMVSASGALDMALMKVVGHQEQWLTGRRVGAVTAGQTVHLRFQVTGTDTVTLTAKQWATTEEEAATLTATDTTGTITAPGQVVLDSYLATAASSLVVRYDDLSVTGK